MLNGVLPSWVEQDPLKSRAVDPLGLQVVSDRLADRMLPGLSVLTNRARYYSFLCWARGQAGKTADERQIHQLEVALALTEARLSAADPAHNECRFIGKNAIAPYLKDHADAEVLARDPRTIYKVPAWRFYRASMVHLGLLERSSRYTLTDYGHEAASAFRRAVGVRSRRVPQHACLSRIRESSREKKLLRDALGLSLRGKLNDEDWNSSDSRTRRAAMGRLMRRFSPDGRHLIPADALNHFATKSSPSLPEPQNTLRSAAVWEYLSLGLNLIFVAWVRAADSNEFKTYRRALHASLGGRRTRSSLSDVSLQDNDFEATTKNAVACLGYAVALFEQLPVQGSGLIDENRFQLARSLIDRRLSATRRAEEVLQSLFCLHQSAKGDEAWLCANDHGRLDQFCLNRDRKKSWQPPKRVAMHGYRIPQFGQIAYDLGGY